MKTIPHQPQHNCSLCPRLAEFRGDNRQAYPSFFNGPVPSFGPLAAPLLIVGLAPGLKGANQTGRPFTGDYAGKLLYSTLSRLGLARGAYDRRADDGLELRGVRVTNAVRCVPPQNKPLPLEINTCLGFLGAEIAAMPNLRAVLSLGQISHNAVSKLFGVKKKDHPFSHGAIIKIGERTLVSSYHCSRYNTNTGVLTPLMFETAMLKAKAAARI